MRKCQINVHTVQIEIYLCTCALFATRHFQQILLRHGQACLEQERTHCSMLKTLLKYIEHIHIMYTELSVKIPFIWPTALPTKSRFYKCHSDNGP